MSREELALCRHQQRPETHRPVPHHEIVQALVETLRFRHIGVAHDDLTFRFAAQVLRSRHDSAEGAEVRDSFDLAIVLDYSCQATCCLKL